MTKTILESQSPSLIALGHQTDFKNSVSTWRATPLVAIQTWNDIASLDAIANCGPCQERLKQLDQTLIAHWSDGDEPADAGKLPRFPRLKWTDPPAIIAEAVIDDLNKRSILGQSMTVLEGTAGWDLIPKVPIYVQFCLEIGGELLIEARGTSVTGMSS